MLPPSFTKFVYPVLRSQINVRLLAFLPIRKAEVSWKSLLGTPCSSSLFFGLFASELLNCFCFSRDLTTLLYRETIGARLVKSRPFTANVLDCMPLSSLSVFVCVFGLSTGGCEVLGKLSADAGRLPLTARLAPCTHPPAASCWSGPEQAHSLPLSGIINCDICRAVFALVCSSRGFASPS